MKIHLIVNNHEGGFFSNFNKITTFLKNTKYRVVKITWNLQGQPFGAFAYNCGEVFSKLFVPFDTGEKPDTTINLDTYTDTAFTGKQVHDKYEQKQWRYEYFETLKFFNPTTTLAECKDKIDLNYFFSSEKINLIGILKRNELLKCEQIDNKMPELEDYYLKIDNIFTDNSYLYLSVDNNHDLNAFVSRYKRCIFNTKMRRTNFCYDQEPHFLPGAAEDAMHTYLDVYSLSKCKSFIHPLSNMATAALYFNPSLHSIYI